MIKIAVANQKGGVGKTTTAMTLAHGCARNFLATLVIDLDPQGHIAYSFNVDKSPSLHRFIVSESDIDDVVINVRPNLDVILSDKKTYKVKRFLNSEGADGETILSDFTDDLGYEVVFFDVAPSLDILQVAALVAADFVIVPTKLDAMAVDGVNEVLKSLLNIKTATKKDLSYCVLPTFFERVTNETSLQMNELIQAYDRNVWEPIPQDTRTREAPAHGQTLWEYDQHTPAIAGYNHNGLRIGGYGKALERLINEVIL